MPFSIRPHIRRAFRLALRDRHRAHDEIDEELRLHIELRVGQLMARGLTREHALAEAQLRFGTSWDEAVSRLHDAASRRETRVAWRERLAALRHDLGYVVRSLVRQPGFALIVVLTFALGIGANATMFGVIHRLLLRPPSDVTRPEEIVQVGIRAGAPGREFFNGSLHYPLYKLLVADSTTFHDLALSTPRERTTLGRGPDAEPIFTSLVNGEYFAALGVRPVAGRFFRADEDRESGGDAVVVLSHGFWQRRFGGDRTIIGKRLFIGPDHLTVVGIAPAGFTGVEPKRIDAWIPIGSDGALRSDHRQWASDWGSWWLRIYARLEPGVQPAAAADRLRANFAAAFVALYHTDGSRPDIERPRFELRSILPGQQLGGSAEAKVSRLLAAVSAIVLLVACANVGNLLLARGTARRREIAVRLALGISRARLLRLLLAETVVLAVAGGAIAVITTIWGVHLVRATLLQDFAWDASALDGRVLAVTLVLVIVTTLLAGLTPALRASSLDVSASLKAGGRENSPDHARARSALVIVQASLSVVLIVGTGLFVQSLREVASLRLGYAPERVIGATMDLSAVGYKAAARDALFETMRERVATLAGVASVATAATHPLDGSSFSSGFRIPGRSTRPDGSNGGPYFNPVGARYFETLGLRVVEGRAISAQDVSTRAAVAVVSEPMARAYWPRERATGQCVMLGDDSSCTTVIGVVSDARERVLSDAQTFMMYVPMGRDWNISGNVLLVRSHDDDPARLVEPIRKAMQSVAPNLPYADVQPFDALLASQLRPWKTGATLFALFGILALVIATVGLYSAISYSVAQRRREFGIRMALGAHLDDIVRLVMAQGLRVATIGIVVGSGVAVLGGRFIADLLFQTSPRNPVVFAVVAGTMLIVAAAATFIPAWRASRVDPLTALRAD